MCKQKTLNLALVRVIITTVLIIAMAVTSAPTAHAVDNVEVAECAINTASLTYMSATYEALENKLITMEQEEIEKEIDLSKAKLQLIERQIMLLYQEIDQLEQQFTWYYDLHQKSQNQLKVEQNKLDNEHETNKQKMQSINSNLAKTCVDVVVKGKKVSSVIGQVSELKHLASNNQYTITQIGQIGENGEFINGLLIRNRERLSKLNSILDSKRQSAYDCLNHINRKDMSFGDLISRGDTNSIVMNIKKNGTVWASPCVYTCVASGFGYRIHPILGVRKMHNGVDLTNGQKTPIYATRSGVVVDSAYDASSGYHVIIDHLDGYKSYYYHLYKKSDLQVGDVVVIGDYIGGMGTTGLSTGTHLHFGVSCKDEYVDPMKYIKNN
jgi:septal ring factor EnvC (AmiA/AmiB activator)